MCRNKMVLGFSLIAGGAGILLGLLIESPFFSFLIAAGLIIAGILLLSR